MDKSKYYEENKEKRIEYGINYYKKHREERKKAMRDYYEENKEEIKKKMKKYNGTYVGKNHIIKTEKGLRNLIKRLVERQEGVELTPNAEKIINAKLRFFKGGDLKLCPCDRGEGSKRWCGSVLCKKDLYEKGHCHCNLYRLKGNNDE